MGYSPWGRKELDTTEPLHFLFHFFLIENLEEGGYRTSCSPVAICLGLKLIFIVFLLSCPF